MGIVVADRKFFGEIGSLDGGMKIYGGENVELGIRVRFSGCASGVALYREGNVVNVSFPLWSRLVYITAISWLP